ncbi:hypothetical protein NDU88_008011 [Pleurodeles waltl]|uniref:Uncharacterized protein n=1 Tax=Pleurodeles waltl TaxID=8319 RepID=A0AAV7N3P6_PLEWA|nr:hypothetical protein NDU88_008011 [Pleurodeles waltl]
MNPLTCQTLASGCHMWLPARPQLLKGGNHISCYNAFDYCDQQEDGGEHGESTMAGRESVMQVLCTGLQKPCTVCTGSAYSELHKTGSFELKPTEESGF